MTGFGDGNVVAVKVPHLFSTLPEYLRERRALYLEIVSWKTLKHPHLLPFLGLATCQGFGDLCMVSPFMSKGTLRKHISSDLSQSTRLRYLREVVEGMVYLHSESLIHGDLHTGNIFLSDDDHVLLADFGLCVLAGNLSRGYYSRRAGNARWLAPELLAPHKYSTTDAPNNGRPTRQSDVDTFACMCIELYSGRIPFEGKYDDEVPALVIRPNMERPPRPINMSNQLGTLVSRCWADKAADRPLFPDIGAALDGENAEDSG
ncbi:kinase-like domain-containing protein [Irpex lacteus]|nr:kinase-like domain-containing protein [Irpex lacteus]